VDLGDLFTPDDLGLGMFEDFLAIKNHDGNYYGFLVDYTGRRYQKIMYVKSKGYDFKDIVDYGVAWNQKNRRPRWIEYDPFQREYHMILYNRAEGIPTCIVTSESAFPLGWHEEVNLLAKGRLGSFDDGAVYPNTIFNFGSNLKTLLYTGRKRSQPYDTRFGLAYGWNLKHPMQKSRRNPLACPQGKWCGTLFDGRGTLHLGKTALLAIEGKSSSKWSIGFAAIKVDGDTVVVAEHPGNPILTDSLGFVPKGLSVANPYWLSDEGQYDKSEFILYFNYMSERDKWDRLRAFRYLAK